MSEARNSTALAISSALLKSKPDVCQAPSKGTANGCFLRVDLARVIAPCHMPWPVRRASTLRGKQLLDRVRHAQHNHAQVEQRGHEGQARRFLAAVQARRRDEHARRFSLQFAVEPQRGQSIHLVLEL